MEKEVDIEEMKNCLKEADIFEEGMDKVQILQCYNAVRNSEASLQEESRRSFDDEASKSLNESANELTEAIRTSEVVAPSKKNLGNDESWEVFVKNIPKNLTKHRVVQEEKETTQEKNNNHKVQLENKSQVTDNVLDIKKTPIGFDDMPESQKSENYYLKIIHHDLKFVNIQNSNKFLSTNSDNRIKMLLNYHRAVAKLKSHYASSSKIMAPIGKPITAIDTHMSINPVISSLEDEDFPSSQQDVYVSRSGRMTKKRLYNDNEAFDEMLLESGLTKKTKNEDDWLKKSPKTNIRRSSMEEAPVNSNNNTKVKKIDLANTDSEDLFDILDDVPTPIATPMKPCTTQKKFLANEEIMDRSSLFKDTPKRGGGRTNAILNAAKEVTERQKQQEEVIEKFTNSLDADSQAFDDDPDKVIFVDQIESRRITPVVPRKPIHGRKRGGGAGPLNITTKRAKVNEEPKTAAVNGLGKKNIKRVPSKNTTSEQNPSTSKNKRECPICRVSFPSKEIEEHAATCGEDVFPQSTQHTRLTCEICDTVIPFSTQYEIHVKACLAKKNG